MKEAILINYTGRRGSGPLISYEIAKALIENGERVVAVVSQYAENVEKWEKLNLLQLIKIKTYRNKLDFVINTLIFNIITKNALRQQLKKINIAAVYCPMETFWTKAINDLVDAKIVYAIHDPVPHAGYELIAKLTPKPKADAFVVHSKKFVREVERKYGKPVAYIPLGRHNLYKELKRVNGESLYSEEKINFLFFGTISKYKGLHVLAKAYEKAYAQNNQITLTIAGHGDFSTYEKDFSELKNVTLMNRWIKDEEVQRLFEGPNVITVLPYVEATQSGVVLVAYEYQSPVIGTKTGGLDEQIEQDISGILVRPNQPDELADAMLQLASSPELRKKFAEGGSRSLEEREWITLAKSLIVLLNNRI